MTSDQQIVFNRSTAEKVPFHGPESAGTAPVATHYATVWR